MTKPRNWAPCFARFASFARHDIFNESDTEEELLSWGLQLAKRQEASPGHCHASFSLASGTALHSSGTIMSSILKSI